MGSAFSFADRLANRVKETGNPVMVGLDPRPELLPWSLLAAHGVDPNAPYASLDKLAAAYEEFCFGVLTAVQGTVPAVKVQSAFFERLGPRGFEVQRRVVAEARKAGVIVVLDVKRSDIGSTATAYADAALCGPPAGIWDADAVTVNPYLGPDSLEPFLRHVRSSHRGIFVLLRTSNPGAAQLQEARLQDGRTVMEIVADWIARWAEETRGECGLGSVGAVVGGTAPGSLDHLRRQLPHVWFLVPGYGAQGASADDVRKAFRPDGLGALVNSSRAILLQARRAEQEGKDWTEGIRGAVDRMISELTR